MSWKRYAVWLVIALLLSLCVLWLTNIYDRSAVNADARLPRLIQPMTNVALGENPFIQPYDDFWQKPRMNLLVLPSDSSARYFVPVTITNAPTGQHASNVSKLASMHLAVHNLLAKSIMKVAGARSRTLVFIALLLSFWLGRFSVALGDFRLGLRRHDFRG